MSDRDLMTIDGDEDTMLVRNDPGTTALFNRSDIEAQVATAHRYPRSLGRFLQNAITMATIDEEMAAACFYALPRGGKTISGPSVRLAEICAACWGNLRIGARPIEVGAEDVTSQGTCWDTESNVLYTVETKRRITNKSGKRYDDDMIIVTQNAANSIALRNAIFRVIPRSFVKKIEDAARKVAVGDAKTLSTRRAIVIERLAKYGADVARILFAVQKSSVEDIGLGELETLLGYGTSLKDGTKSVDELFPEPPKLTASAEGATPPAAEGARLPLGEAGAKKASRKDDLAAMAAKAAAGSKAKEPEPAKETPPAAKEAEQPGLKLDPPAEREPGADG
jgi:hypothetical protein